MKPILAVAGRPIAHSLSPELHKLCFEALGVDGISFRFSSSNADALLNFSRHVGLSGLNVTSPLKEAVAILVNLADESAKQLSALNTIKFSRDRPLGFNTDTDGVYRTVFSARNSQKLKSALVLGAGGAARSAILALKKLGLEVTVANRSLDKAQKVAADLETSILSFDQLFTEGSANHFDCVISCLAREASLDHSFIRSNQVVLDANYGASGGLSAAARGIGAEVLNPLDWLFFQGVASVEHILDRSIGRLDELRQKFQALKAETPKRGPIALIGYMGAGKTSVASALGKQLDRKVINLDEEIERKAGKKISEIFKCEGETRFREIESKIFCEVANMGDLIIDCGGGVPLSHNNRQLLREATRCIWLWADPQHTIDRVRSSEDRPLLPSFENLKVHMKERLELYAETCWFCVDTTYESAGAVASQIIEELDE